MSHGLLEILRYFLLALLWLFFIYAIRMVIVEVRRGRAVDASGNEPTGGEAAGRERGGRLRLRIIDPPELRNAAFDLGDEITIGRSPDCVVTLADDTFASSMHARVFPHSNALWVEDLGSTNGTFVNNRRLSEPARVKRGDRIKVGNTIFEVAR